MSTTCWVLVGIIAVSLILYFVFKFAKEIKIIQDISSSILLPCIGILNYLFLLPLIPDSYHIIKLTSLSFIFISLAVVTKNFFDNKKASQIESILYCISVGAWLSLFRSVFLIHRIPVWANIIALASYTILCLLFYIIFIKKQSFSFYFLSFISFALTALLHYCSFLFLCFEPVKYNLILFIGTSFLLGYLIFDILSKTVLNLKLKKLISLFILLASEVLIALSVLMIFY